MRFFILFFLFISVGVSAQLDKKQQPIRLELKNPFEKSNESPNSDLPSLEYKSMFDKGDSNLSKYSILNKSNEPSKSILDTSTDFKNPGDIIRDKLNGEIAKEGSWEDVFFGKFVVNTPIIKIMARDFADPDGDRVQILLNSTITVNNITLGSSYKSYYIDLREGENLLDILALNQGTAGPNTANFAIYDSNNNLIINNDWNLKQGVAAKFVIEYRKPIESSK